MKDLPKLSRAEWAYAQLIFEENHEKILTIVRRHLSNLCESSIEVVMQEIFFRACINVQKMASCKSPAAWLAATAHNVALEEVNRLLRQEELSDSIAAPQSPPFGIESILPKNTPSIDRDILTRYYDHRDNTAEIAQDLDLTPDTVRHRLRRAKQRLRKNLKNFEK